MRAIGREGRGGKCGLAALTKIREAWEGTGARFADGGYVKG